MDHDAKRILFVVKEIVKKNVLSQSEKNLGIKL